jgi:ring-1,2-phenylacetyl-CoA epoxidase subunit PaaB
MWEVFKQDKSDKPHQAVGSVQASDAEMALLEARHVFARRPQAVSLWVAKQSDIFSATAEELTALTRLHGPAVSAIKTYAVFGKASHKRSMVFVEYIGGFEGQSPVEAILHAEKIFKGLAWWAIPLEKLHKSPIDSQTLESWFSPANEKTYKQQSYYGTVGAHVSKYKEPHKEPHKESRED